MILGSLHSELVETDSKLRLCALLDRTRRARIGDASLTMSHKPLMCVADNPCSNCRLQFRSSPLLMPATRGISRSFSAPSGASLLAMLLLSPLAAVKKPQFWLIPRSMGINSSPDSVSPCSPATAGVPTASTQNLPRSWLQTESRVMSTSVSHTEGSQGL